MRYAVFALAAVLLSGCATKCISDWPLAALNVAASAATGDVAGIALHSASMTADAGRSAACQRREP